MKRILVLLALIFAACTPPGSVDTLPTGKGGGTFPLQIPSPTFPHFRKPYNGIYYHGGHVMVNGPGVYLIWYGNWAGNTAPQIIEHLVSNLGGSPYFNTLSTYFDSNKTHISNSVAFLGSITDNYSHGLSLSDTDIRDIVMSAINRGLPLNEDAVYFVLTSTDVDETSGFCYIYCGWHNFMVWNGAHVRYSFVGNSDKCNTACEAQTIGPNDNAGADGMASVIVHELCEAATDGDLNAWYDTDGAENGDLCAWNFGQTYTAANGSMANLNLNGKDFLIQQMWINDYDTGKCGLSYP